MENGKQGAFAMLDPNGSFTQYGLTKREYFAGLALQGLLANNEWLKLLIEDGNFDDYSVRLTNSSLHIADELLKQLEQ